MEASLTRSLLHSREEDSSIKCVYATKIGDSLLRDEEGSLILIHPDTFYDRGVSGYWMLKKIGSNWKILRVLIA